MLFRPALIPRNRARRIVGRSKRVIAVRSADKDKPWVKILVDSYHMPEVKEFILTKFKGAVLPSW